MDIDAPTLVLMVSRRLSMLATTIRRDQALAIREAGVNGMEGRTAWRAVQVGTGLRLALSHTAQAQYGCN